MGKNKGSSGKVRFINPPNTLKTKVGTGGIDESLLKKSQQFIDNAQVDFMPYAERYLKQLGDCTRLLKKGPDDPKPAQEKMIGAIMQLKAHGGMFQYQLLSDVADIALQFLESIEGINQDALTVLQAHENTIKVIINSNLKGDGGREGYALVKELDSACQRYFSKHEKKAQ